jgi:two-component system, chemotaxis family, response regulator Rcp1
MAKTMSARTSGTAVRISLVEDNPRDVYLLEKALSDHHIDYELTRYEDGEQAIKAFSKLDCPRPDLILLDLKLPRREGFDVLRAIRSRPVLVGVPVGILTSSNAVQDRHRVNLIG